MPIFGLFLAICTVFFATRPAMAAEEFDLQYTSTYEVVSDDTVQAHHQISLTNKTSSIYATSFSFDVGLTQVGDILVKDRLGNINPKITREPNRTHLEFDFNDKVAGKNKTNTFTISYTSKDILSKNGSVWELNIPKLTAQHRSATFDVTLIVPKKINKAAFISPKPVSEVAQADRYIYVFPQFSSTEPGITALFGHTQYLQFDLSYHLENPLGEQATTQIALPPDTNYQKIILESLTPKPQSMTLDADGNWLASYQLEPKSSLDIKAKGTARLSFTPQSVLLTDEQRELYTKPSTYWHSDSETILKLAQKLKTPKNIYEYVTDHLRYDYQKINDPAGRSGSLKALENPHYAICTEFTDLTIALLRAAGIPARELEGYAFSTNDKLRPLSLTQDILHAWVEYYNSDKQAWIQIDPTWGQTTGGIDYFSKLDLSHLVFVVHGSSSIEPSPAGAYKDKNNPGKDVQVQAVTPIEEPSPKLTISLPQDYNPRYPKLSVTNEGQTTSTLDLLLTSPDARTINSLAKISNLLPYGSVKIDIPINFRFTLKPVPIMLSISDGTQTTNLTIDYQKPLPPTSLLAILAGCLVLLTTTLYAWSLRLRGRKGRLPLHW